MKNYGILILSIILIIIGISGLLIVPYLTRIINSNDIDQEFSSLGEQIYFTGRGSNDRIINFNYGPGWLRMHGGSCASCHGDDGQGGLQIMMSNEEPPAITWKSLTEEEHQEESNGEEEHPPFDERTIKRAIEEGLDPAGKTLDYIMPRWQMNEQELEAIVDFLKELD